MDHDFSIIRATLFRRFLDAHTSKPSRRLLKTSQVNLKRNSREQKWHLLIIWKMLVCSGFLAFFLICLHHHVPQLDRQGERLYVVYHIVVLCHHGMLATVLVAGKGSVDHPSPLKAAGHSAEQHSQASRNTIPTLEIQAGLDACL